MLVRDHSQSIHVKFGSVDIEIKWLELLFHQMLLGDFKWQQDRLLALCYRVYGFLLFVGSKPPKRLVLARNKVVPDIVLLEGTDEI